MVLQGAMRLKKKNVLVASYDMEIGGVERSLLSFMRSFDYDKYDVDLMLYRHSGEFMKLLEGKFNLLEEVSQYTAIRKSVFELLKEGKYYFAAARIFARISAKGYARKNGLHDYGCIQMQRMWQFLINRLPSASRSYDVAVSYLWPHYYVAEKVQAKIKIAWIHTDFSIIETDLKEDLRIWYKFNYIVAVSDQCRNTFLKKYPGLKDKVIVMENIMCPDIIRKLSMEYMEDNEVSKDDFNIVTVARLSTAKGIDNAVRALKVLYGRGLKNIKWRIVGYGGDEELIRKLIADNKLEGKFIILGKKENPYPYIKACDLYVQPSRYEGRAVTVTEAQILGKPVIITNYATAGSQLRDGIDGIICPLSVGGLAASIEKIYYTPDARRRLSVNCMNNNYDNKDEIGKLYRLIQ